MLIDVQNEINVSTGMDLSTSELAGCIMGYHFVSFYDKNPLYGPYRRYTSIVPTSKGKLPRCFGWELPTLLTAAQKWDPRFKVLWLRNHVRNQYKTPPKKKKTLQGLLCYYTFLQISFGWNFKKSQKQDTVSS